MTQPPDEPTELEVIEQETAEAATEAMVKDMATMYAMVPVLWPDATEGSESHTIAVSLLARLNVQRLNRRTSTAQDEIAHGVARAIEHSANETTRAIRNLGISVRRVTAPAPSEEVLALVAHVDEAVREQVKKSQALLRQAKSQAQARTALNVANHAVNRVRAAATHTVNQSANETSIAVADRHDNVKQLWQPERDACVHCLAYAGKTRTREGFPPGLTFGDKPLKTERLNAPPLHPNCRCQLIVVSRSDTETAAGLQREAQRSVLRGFSMESESENTRIAAAERLLSQGTRLPQSVQQYARTAIKQGRFPQGRAFPT